MKKLKRQRIPVLLFILILISALGFFLYGLLNSLITSDYRDQIAVKLTETDQNLDESLDSIKKDNKNYERLLKIYTELAVYYIKESNTSDFSQILLAKLCHFLSVENVLLMDPEGNIKYFAKPLSKEIDPEEKGSSSPLFQLDTGKESDSTIYEEDMEEGDLKYIGLSSSKIDPDNILVIVSDMSEIRYIAGLSSTWKSMMERNTIGKGGFTFAVASDGIFEYFPFDPALGKGSDYVEYIDSVDVSEAGLSLSDFQDGAFKHINICGEDYFCGIKYRKAENAWIICALPDKEIRTSILAILIPVLIFTLIILTLLSLAHLMIITGYLQSKQEGSGPRSFFIRKSRALFAFSIVLLLVFSMYTNLLYSTSVQISVNRQNAESLAYSISNEKKDQSSIKQHFKEFLLKISGVTARILSDNTDMKARASLSRLNSILQTEHILIYDKSGTVIASDSTYKGLKLSEKNEDPSSQFRQLLYGTPYVLQEEPDENYLEKPYLYMGSLLTNKDGDPDGFVQLALSPDFLSEPLKASSKEYILSTYSGTNSSFVLASDKKTGELSYDPSDSLTGKPAAAFGITEKALRDGYVGYITISGVRHLCVTSSTDNDYILIVTPSSKLMSGNLRIALLTFLPCFAAVFLLYVLLILLSGVSGSPESRTEVSPEAAVHSDESLKHFIKGAFFACSGVIFFISTLYERLLSPDSIFSYILNGGWENGVHLFSVTWCIICICFVGFLTICLNILLMQIGNNLNSRGKTMSHMLISLLKYAAIIGVIFSCANKLGVHTDTLLASAGILTVVIGLGAQSLTSDVFDGLFLIIEGAFHVGDVITVDGCRGKVLEIGIRNTRLLDVDTNNIKIVNNSSLKHIVNHSNTPESIFLTIGIDYDEKLEDIEKIIEKEIPVMKKNIPLAVSGPDYLGVDAFEDSAVVLKFFISCRAQDYYKVRRSLNRELKLMFDRNGISIPFNQIVLSER